MEIASFHFKFIIAESDNFTLSMGGGDHCAVFGCSNDWRKREKYVSFKD